MEHPHPHHTHLLISHYNPHSSLHQEQVSWSTLILTTPTCSYLTTIHTHHYIKNKFHGAPLSSPHPLAHILQQSTLITTSRTSLMEHPHPHHTHSPISHNNPHSSQVSWSTLILTTPTRPYLTTIHTHHYIKNKFHGAPSSSPHPLAHISQQSTLITTSRTSLMEHPHPHHIHLLISHSTPHLSLHISFSQCIFFCFLLLTNSCTPFLEDNYT